MWSRFVQLLRTPKFADEDQTRAAGVLHVILLTLFVVLGLLALMTNHPLTIFVTAGMSVAFFGLWLLMRRGFVRFVSWCLMICLVAGITLIVYFNGSIRVPAASGFVACIVVAGLTLGNRATISSAVVISGILYVLYRLEVMGKLPPIFYQSTGFLQWATYAGIMSITAVLLILARSSILNALALARSNEQILAERNRELQAEIIERQEAEHALRESESRYRNLFELESDAILLIDVETMEIWDANPAAIQLYGYCRVEMLSMSATDIATDPEQARQTISADDEMVYIPIHYHQRKDGKTFPVEITGRFFDWQSKRLLLVAIRDITDRVKADEAIKASERKFSLAFHANPSLMAISRVADGTYYEVNQTFVEKLGYTREEIIGHSSLDLSLWHNPSQRQILLDQLQEKGVAHNVEVSVRKKDGSLLTTLFSAEYLPLDGDVFLLTIGHDISERKQAQENLRRLNDELERRVAERTAELSATNQELETFSYSVAHDLRTPLRAIDGFSRMLLEEHTSQLDEEGCFYLDRIITANRRMSTLIDDLLSLSRLARSELVRQPVDLGQVAREILSEFALHDPQRTVDWVVGDNLNVSADPHLMRLVLENLFSNAWKFTAKTDAARIELGVQDGKKRVYYVRDNGAGFNMTYANKLFGAFQRLHAADEFPGTGIGLATVKRIIERHGGEVWATGEVNSGATFFFTLP
jgi:PAS domain S-box-containing protein